MDELNTFEGYSEDGEPVRFFHMAEIVVDGIYGSARNAIGDSAVCSNEMFSLKHDLDWTQPMHYTPDFQIDEVAWLREGLIIRKN